jgi:hypothetical protein
MRSLFVRVAIRAIFMLNIPSLFLLSGPRGTRAGPGRKSIPFGPPHSAFFVTYSDKNKGSIIAACFRTNENCRNAVGVPDDRCVCHFNSRRVSSARLAILADVDRAELPLQNSRGSNQQHKEDRYQ